jgi:hypothetical protein
MIPALPEDMSVSPRKPRCWPRPIFVIGALRSGASLLTLSLGQHARLRPVLNNSWYEQFGAGLQLAYADGVRPRATSELDVSGIEIEDFFAHFGEAIDRLLLPDHLDAELAATSDRRWVDGTPTNAFHTFLLCRLFPRARFIHVFRDVEETVAALVNEDNRSLYKSQHVRLNECDAHLNWLEAVNACVTAERAFGSETVLRVRRADLIEVPDKSIGRCLEFLGEPFDPACLRAFSSVSPAPDQKSVRSDATTGKVCHPEIRLAAELLNSALLDETSPAYARDESRIAELEAAFHARCRRGETAVPRRPPYIQGEPSAAQRRTDRSRKRTVPRWFDLDWIRSVLPGAR